MTEADQDAGSGGGGNLLALAAEKGFRLGSGLAINVMLMRALGVDGFGVYGTIMTLVGVATFGSTLGMERLINRELSREPELTGELVGTGLLATALLSLLTGAAVVAWALAFDGRGSFVLATGLAAVALALRGLVMIPEAAFHAMRRMRLSVQGHLAGRVVLVLATGGFLLAGFGIVAVFTAQLLDALVTLAVVGWAFRRHVGTGGLRASSQAVRGLVRRAWPFGLNLLYGSIYLQVDVLLLAVLRDDTEVGVYRGAVMLIALFPVIATTLTTGVFPRMSRHLGQPEAASDELSFVLRVLLALSLPAAVGGMLVAEELMVFLGGAPFAVSALPFVIMAPLLPLRFVNNATAMTLSALNRQEDRTRGVFYAAIFNLLANLAVIPTWGALGAAATTLATEILLAAWFRWRITGLVHGLGLGSSLLRTGLPALFMAGLILALPAIHVLFTVLLGAVAYGGLGLATGAWHPRDLRRLRRV